METELNQIEDSLLIRLLPGYTELELDPQQLELEFQKILGVNGATMDFLNGQLDAETFLDVVEYFNGDMDNYIAETTENLKLIIDL